MCVRYSGLFVVLQKISFVDFKCMVGARGGVLNYHFLLDKHPEGGWGDGKRGNKACTQIPSSGSPH